MIVIKIVFLLKQNDCMYICLLIWISVGSLLCFTTVTKTFFHGFRDKRGKCRHTSLPQTFCCTMMTGLEDSCALFVWIFYHTLVFHDQREKEKEMTILFSVDGEFALLFLFFLSPVCFSHFYLLLVNQDREVKEKRQQSPSSKSGRK